MIAAATDQGMPLRNESLASARLTLATARENRVYLPAVNSRRPDWKACGPGNAQYRSIGLSRSISSCTRSTWASNGRSAAAAEASRSAASSRVDQVSLRYWERLL